MQENRFIYTVKITMTCRFANMKVVKAMAILLQGFETNSIEVNHYIVKMLHRIAWDCKMSAMIFQASIFRIFQKILNSKTSQHKVKKKIWKSTNFCLFKSEFLVFTKIINNEQKKKIGIFFTSK